MHSLKHVVISFTLAVYVLVSPAVGAAPLEPYQYVLALQRLQDQVVQGDKMAHQAQREMLALMAADFAKLRVADWQKKKNAEALLIYLLSGGNPDFIEELLEIKNQPRLPEGVLAGAYAYVFGHFAKAKNLFDKAELQDMSINARSQIAIVQATLYAEKDYRKALQHLSKVRLWKPGTLLEEAALRRAFSLAGVHGDADKFLSWASQYVRRFERSFYFPEFMSKFSFYVTKFNLAGKPKYVEKVEQIIKHLKTNQQASIYLTVARAAVLDGNNTQALFMAGKASKLLKQGTSYAARATLYSTASQVATAAPQKIAALLDEINTTLLNKQDRKIFEIIKLMIAEVQKKPQLTEAGMVGKKTSALQRKLEESQIEQVSPMVSKAQKLFDNATQLLRAKR